jgi:hypothetical protein
MDTLWDKSATITFEFSENFLMTMPTGKVSNLSELFLRLQSQSLTFFVQ